MDSERQHGTDTGETGSEQRSSAGSDNRSSLADQLRQQASTRFSGEKDRAIQGLTSLVEAVRQTGQQLRDKDQAGIATYIDSAADQAARFSEQLGNKDLSELVDDVQRFAHRRPALFLGISFGLGVAAARFLKSSRPQAQGTRASGSEFGRSNFGAGGAYTTAGSSYAATNGAAKYGGAGFDCSASTSAASSSQPRMAIAPPPASPRNATAGTLSAGLPNTTTGQVPESALSSTARSLDTDDDGVGATTGEISRATAVPRTTRRPRTEQ